MNGYARPVLVQTACCILPWLLALIKVCKSFYARIKHQTDERIAESEARAFFLELLDFALLNVRRSVHDAKQRRVIPKTRLHDASLQFTDALQQTDEHLRSVIKTLPRPSPKRKMNGVATNGSAPGGSVSQTSRYASFSLIF